MRVLDKKTVYKHFKNNILKYIITNGKFDKKKIYEKEKENILIPIGHGNIAKIYKIKIDNDYYAFKLFYENFNESVENYDFENEQNTLNITSKYIEDDMCPNFLYCYKISNDNYKYILLEYADGTIYDLLKNF